MGGHPGNPGDIRYWQNIIPEHYEITTRQGMSYKTTLNGDENQPWEYQWHEHSYTIDGNGNGETQLHCYNEVNPEDLSFSEGEIPWCIVYDCKLEGFLNPEYFINPTTNQPTEPLGGELVIIGPNNHDSEDSCTPGSKLTYEIGQGWNFESAIGFQTIDGHPHLFTNCLYSLKVDLDLIFTHPGIEDLILVAALPSEIELPANTSSPSICHKHIIRNYQLLDSKSDCWDGQPNPYDPGTFLGCQDLYQLDGVGPHNHDIGLVYEIDHESPQNWLPYDIYDEGLTTAVIIAEDNNNDDVLYWGEVFTVPGFVTDSGQEVLEFYYSNGHDACESESRYCWGIEVKYNNMQPYSEDGVISGEWTTPLEHYSGNAYQYHGPITCDTHLGIGAITGNMFQFMTTMRAICTGGGEILETVIPYYPVVPKLKTDGTFSTELQELEMEYRERIRMSEAVTTFHKLPFGDPLRAWYQDDSKAAVNNLQPYYKGQYNSIMVDLDISEIDGESNTIDDKGGGLNKGHLTSDYVVDFDPDERRPVASSPVNQIDINKDKDEKAY